MTSSAALDLEYIERQWATSFPDYARDHLKVQHPTTGMQPFVLNNVQSAIEDVVAHIRSEGRRVRIVTLKDRRRGVSTYWVGRFSWKTSTTPSKYAFLLSHEPQSTSYLFEMGKRMYDNLPFPEWKPKTKYNNANKIQFIKPLDSAITVATASKEQAGSSQLINYLLASEISKWPPSTTQALLTSVFQCVPDDDDSEMVMESTANGIGGEFYKHYWAARYEYRFFLDSDGKLAWKCEVNEKADKSNVWSRIFIPWFVTSDNEMAIARWEAGAGEEFKRTEEEEKIVQLHMSTINKTVANRKLCWRRVTIQTSCLKSVQIFNQEHPDSAEAAFISTGNAAFDVYQIMALMKAAPEPIMSYEILTGTGDFIAKPDNTGRMWVWEEPQPDRSYLISADVAEGVLVAREKDRDEFDFSVFDVWDQLTGVQVAQFHGSVDPDEFGRMLCTAGRRYNMAWLVPERNNHGQSVLNTIMNAGYPHIYVERIPDPPGKPRKRFGFLTSRGNKSSMIDQLIAELRDGTHGIRSKRTFGEMLSYKKDAEGRYNAEEGLHDDLVMSCAIGKFVRATLPLPSTQRGRRLGTGIFRSQYNLPPALRQSKQGRPSMKGWGG